MQVRAEGEERGRWYLVGVQRLQQLDAAGDLVLAAHGRNFELRLEILCHQAAHRRRRRAAAAAHGGV